MARLKRIEIDHDKKIARALLKPGTESRRQLLARANLAGIHYRRLGERIVAQKGYNSPSHPFEQKKQDSVLDKKAHSAKVVNGELIIEVQGEAAPFVEEGNAGVQGEKMIIRVKPSSVRKKRSKRGKTSYTLSGGARVKKEGGKFFLFTQKVKPAKGYRLLEKAVRSAFR